MKHVFAIALGAFALAMTSASWVQAQPLSARAAGPAVLPVIEVAPVYVLPAYPADFACSPYTCDPGGRRIPAANPEGDPFPTQLGD